MKYSELEKKLKKAGCYPISGEKSGHPLWYSPVTGTLHRILKDAGIK